VASLDILGNVVPFIKNEEEKLEEEVGKLLGSLVGGKVALLDAKVSAHCNRVAVVDGHTECVSIKAAQQGHARADCGGVGGVCAAGRAEAAQRAGAAGGV